MKQRGVVGVPGSSGKGRARDWEIGGGGRVPWRGGVAGPVEKGCAGVLWVVEGGRCRGVSAGEGEGVVAWWARGGLGGEEGH